MKLNWNNTLPNGQTLKAYLLDNYLTYSDREIGRKLSDLLGVTVSRNAVKKARYRFDLFKSDAVSNKQEANNVTTTPDYKTVAITSDTPQTIEELRAQFSIPAAWQTAYCNIAQNLSGSFRISAKFKPPLELPRPIEFNGRYAYPQAKINRLAVSNILVFSDTHIGYRRIGNHLQPFHNRVNMSLMLEVSKILQPDMIVILGDYLDLPAFSKNFRKSPDIMNNTQTAIIEGFYYLKALREANPDAQINLHEGNHDARFRLNMIDLAPHFFGLQQAETAHCLNIPYLLNLEALGINWISDYPNDFVRLNDNVVVHHGNVTNLKRAVEYVPNNTIEIIGHTHRLDSEVRQRNGVVKRLVSTGCLCHLDGRIPGSNANTNWQNGFYHVLASKTQQELRKYQIHDGKVFFNGCVLEGVDYSNMLKGAYPDYF